MRFGAEITSCMVRQRAAYCQMNESFSLVMRELVTDRVQMKSFLVSSCKRNIFVMDFCYDWLLAQIRHDLNKFFLILIA